MTPSLVLDRVVFSIELKKLTNGSYGYVTVTLTREPAVLLPFG
jgi:hypothetical protein